MRRDTSRNGRPRTSAARALARHVGELAQHRGVADVEPLRGRGIGRRHEDRRVGEDLRRAGAPSPRRAARASARRALRRSRRWSARRVHVDVDRVAALAQHAGLGARRVERARDPCAARGRRRTRHSSITSAPGGGAASAGVYCAYGSGITHRHVGLLERLHRERGRAPRARASARSRSARAATWPTSSCRASRAGRAPPSRARLELVGPRRDRIAADADQRADLGQRRARGSRRRARRWAGPRRCSRARARAASRRTRRAPRTACACATGIACGSSAPGFAHGSPAPRQRPHSVLRQSSRYSVRLAARRHVRRCPRRHSRVRALANTCAARARSPAAGTPARCRGEARRERRDRRFERR